MDNLYDWVLENCKFAKKKKKKHKKCKSCGGWVGHWMPSCPGCGHCHSDTTSPSDSVADSSDSGDSGSSDGGGGDGGGGGGVATAAARQNPFDFNSFQQPKQAPVPPQAAPAQQQQQRPQAPGLQSQPKYNPKLDWVELEQRLRKLKPDDPTRQTYLQKFKRNPQEALTYIEQLEQQAFGRVMASWVLDNCKFAAEDDDVNFRKGPGNEPTKVPPPQAEPEQPEPGPQINQARAIILPAGTTLFHGSIEEFQEDQLHVGGYDGLLWTTDDKYGTAIAQSYIPVSGGALYTTPDHVARPTQDETVRKIQRMIGIFYDYDTPGAVTFDQTGRADSWRSPKKFDGSEWEWKDNENTLTPEVVDQLLKAKGYKPKNEASSPQWTTYEFRTNVHELLPPNTKQMGRLFILKSQQPLRIYDYAAGREGDLMEVDYHKHDLFEAVKKAGYDGIKIHDFAQVEDWGNVGHESIGIFPNSVQKLKWESIPAQHPNYDEFRKTRTTPEWAEYQKRTQQP